jgi:hypothetical protein
MAWSHFGRGAGSSAAGRFRQYRAASTTTTNASPNFTTDTPVLGEVSVPVSIAPETRMTMAVTLAIPNVQPAANIRLLAPGRSDSRISTTAMIGTGLNANRPRRRRCFLRSPGPSVAPPRHPPGNVLATMMTCEIGDRSGARGKSTLCCLAHVGFRRCGRRSAHEARRAACLASV